MAYRWYILLAISLLPLTGAAQGIGTLDQWTSTSSPSSAITQRTWGKGIKLTGLTTGECLTLSATSLLTTTTCGSGGSGVGTSTEPFMAKYFVATSTAIASVFPLASTTAFTAVTSYLGTVASGLWNGTAIDISDYTNLTAGDALTLTGDDIDFDGGATPAGDLGGTWASPTVDDDGHAHTSLTISGLDISDDTNLTAGDGLTLTGDDLDCDTASGSVFGCLSSADWTTFNDSVDAARTLTVAGTANQITSSAGAQDLSANRTWTLSIPTDFRVSSTTISGNTLLTSATTTDFDIRNALTFNGVTGSTWASFCTTITGGSGLCDGDDATGAGSTFPFTPDTYAGVGVNATSTALWLKATSPFSLIATSTFATQASSTLFTNSGSTWLSEITSALVLTGATGLVAEYAGTSCTDELVRSLSALGAATCAKVSLTADVTGDLPFANLAQVSANSVLGNITGSTADAASVATSSLFTWNGTGNVARTTSPTFVTPALGTIASGVGTALTALDGENIQDDTIDDDSIDWTDVTIADFAGTQTSGAIAWDLGGSSSFELPNGTGPTVNTDGQCAIDTTSGQLVCDLGTSVKVIGNGNFYPAFTYATSTAWTGTTTIPLGPSYVAETWNGVQCFTDAGTLQVSFSDGTNRMNWMNASTTVGTVGLTSNNTFTAAEKRYVDVGTPASSPTKISCTVSKSITAD